MYKAMYLRSCIQASACKTFERRCKPRTLVFLKLNKSDACTNACNNHQSLTGLAHSDAQAPDKSPEREGPQSGPEPGISGTSDDSNDDGKHAVLT